jgi:uncharacterized protein
MSGRKTRLKVIARAPSQAGKHGHSRSQSQPAQVSGRWLILAVSTAITAAAFCTWGALCLLFWQGCWQLLYHPSPTVARTPSSVGLGFEPVAFAVSDEGVPRLTGWWIPAASDAEFNRFTILLLHGQTGNLGDTVDSLERLHAVGVNVFAFDYRGYGQSRFARPSEAHWRQDTKWALRYLTATRHIDSSTIVLYGEGLGANLALEMAASHSELAGVITESPLAEPVNPIFSDARAQLVPARLLVRDRYDLQAAASKVRIPVLWFEGITPNEESQTYAQIVGRKMVVSLLPSADSGKQVADALARWFGDLNVR